MTTEATPANPPADSITFSGGGVSNTYNERNSDIPDEGFDSVRLSGSESIYYVYPETNMSGHVSPDAVQIVESSAEVPLEVRPPRSCRGFSKEGIILFETSNYGGNSQNFIDSGDIDHFFKPGTDEGVSSMHVLEGTWELHTQSGGSIVIDGKTQFPEGFRVELIPANDRTYSILRVGN